MFNPDSLYDKLSKMSESDKIEILDPICYALHGKATLDNGLEVKADRLFALCILECYKQWQKEMYERE